MEGLFLALCGISTAESGIIRALVRIEVQPLGTKATGFELGTVKLFHLPDGGRNTANTLSEFVIHDSRNTASSGFRSSSAIAPARQNQLISS
jgi:hypothetical protein